MNSYQLTCGKNQAKTEYFIVSQRQMNLKAWFLMFVCLEGTDVMAC